MLHAYTSDVSSRRRLRSVNRQQSMVSRHRRSMFSVGGLSPLRVRWNELASTLTPGLCSEYRQIGSENSSFCGAKEQLAFSKIGQLVGEKRRASLAINKGFRIDTDNPCQKLLKQAYFLINWILKILVKLLGHVFGPPYTVWRKRWPWHL